ncbi:MAG: glycosyltransferase [Candidatus Omnitrophica bacterium]|nr:glycosyltransferase [Candidatus Omnitrophota bacterium]
MKKQLRILIWHVHGSYLYYLTQLPHQFYLPSKADRKGDYIGKFGHIPWGDNVHDVPVDQIKDLELDCIIFQLPHQYLRDQYEILSVDQQSLPKIYLEHDPSPHPTNSKHWVDDPNVLVVHVTAYNRLVWDNGRSPTIFIDHGVIVPADIKYTGEIPCGLVAINHLPQRGRTMGCDIYEQACREVPLNVVGMACEGLSGGLGEVIFKDLPRFEARYRFFFSPVRYTSFPLALCEAMMIGLPIVAVGITEIATLPNNEVGFISNRPEELVKGMKVLLQDYPKAHVLGNNAQRYAQDRFNIHRFIKDWNKALKLSQGYSIHKEFFVSKGG